MPAARRLDFRLTKPQSKAYRLFQKPRTDLNLEWGRGCGKSFFDRFIAWSWIAQADRVPRLELLRRLGVLDELDEAQQAAAAGLRGVRVVFLLPTKKQFVDIHGRLLRQENDDTWSHLRGSLNGTTYQVDFPGGSFIAPFPASEHGSKRALGMRCDIVIADEADDIDIDVFDTIVRPWFSEPGSLKIRITSGTPRRGRHGLLYQRKVAGEDPTKPRYHTIHATYRDNPEIVDLKEVDDARANTPKATFEREWECNFDAGEGLVYNFDQQFHVRQPPALNTFREFIVGVDWGWEDPGAMILIGIVGHGEDAVAWVLDERYESKCENPTWDEYAKAWKFAKFYCDPSRPDRKQDLRKFVSIGETDNSIHAGIARVATLLVRRKHEPTQKRLPSGEIVEVPSPDTSRLYVAPNCLNVIREFGSYRRKKRMDGSISEEPAEGNDHSQDAIRYAIVGKFGLAQSKRTVVSGA